MLLRAEEQNSGHGWLVNMEFGHEGLASLQMEKLDVGMNQVHQLLPSITLDSCRQMTRALHVTVAWMNTLDSQY